MTNLFAHFTSKSTGIYLPGAPFLLGAVFMIAAGILAYNVLSKEEEGKDYVVKTPGAIG